MSRRAYLHLGTPLTQAPVGAQAALSEAEQHPLYRVLRAADGTDLEVADGAGWSASGRLQGGAVTLTTAATLTPPPPAPRLRVVQALPKARRFDEVLRQVTESGVDAVTAITAERSVTRLDEGKAARARARWEAVARSACEQARRPHRPLIAGPVTVDALLAGGLAADAVLLVARPLATALPTVLAEGSAAEVAVAIGPEGGWSSAEVARFAADQRVRRVGPGPTVLRTEYAAAAALAVVAASLGRWEAP